MIYTIDEKPGIGMILSPLKGFTVKAYFKQHVITGALNKNALAMRPESSSADFCLTCLCIYGQDGGCICTKYTKNSSGDYVRNQIPESYVTMGAQMALSNAERQKLHRQKLKAQIANPLRNDEELKDSISRAYHSAFRFSYSPNFSNCMHYQEGVVQFRRYLERELGINIDFHLKPGKPS